MKSFFKELFEYNYQMNQNLIGLMADKSDIISEKCTKLQCHILNAHQIWNSRIIQNQNHFEVWQIHPIQAWKDIDQNNFQSTLSILERFDLAANIRYKTSLGQEFNSNIRDILFHSINHSTYHRGQIASEFKLVGLTPLVTDYIFYRRT